MKNLALAAFGLAPLLAAASALAQDIPPPPPAQTTCTVDADCPDGSSCALPDCPVCDPASPDCTPVDCGPGVCVENPPPEVACTSDADCAADQFCAVPDCAPPCDSADPTCEPVDCSGGGVCLPRGEPPPPPCSSDADCADGTVCITATSESCASTGCACPSDGDNDPSNDPPCDCPPPSEPECTTETYAFCGPRWLDDCAVAEDCGPGFTCEQISDATCSIDSNGNESCDPPTGETQGYCDLIRVECADDTDCSDGFLCVDDASATEPCAVDDTGASNCEAPTATKICVPPGYQQALPVAAEGGERSDGAVDEGDDESDDDGDVVINCAQGNAASLSPLAALGVLVLRRRRR
jgi:uncharacterized protein (TIGR03382 family)